MIELMVDLKERLESKEDKSLSTIKSFYNSLPENIYSDDIVKILNHCKGIDSDIDYILDQCIESE